MRLISCKNIEQDSLLHEKVQPHQCSTRSVVVFILAPILELIIWWQNFWIWFCFKVKCYGNWWWTDHLLMDRMILFDTFWYILIHFDSPWSIKKSECKPSAKDRAMLGAILSHRFFTQLFLVFSHHLHLNFFDRDFHWKILFENGRKRRKKKEREVPFLIHLFLPSFNFSFKIDPQIKSIN